MHEGIDIILMYIYYIYIINALVIPFQSFGYGDIGLGLGLVYSVICIHASVTMHAVSCSSNGIFSYIEGVRSGVYVKI